MRICFASNNGCASLGMVHRVVTALYLVVAVTGCSLVTGRPPPPELEARWSQRADTLQTLENWEFAGRVAIRAADEGLQTHLHWVQAGQNFTIQFSDLLGRRVAALVGEAAGVEFQRHGEPALSAASAEALLARELGWALPVSGMQYWVLGVPRPQTQVTNKRVDRLGRARWLVQDGWRIDYRGYERGTLTALPNQLKLTRDALQVTLVIDRWQLTKP